MSMDQSPERSKLGDLFDRTFGDLKGLPDATQTKPSTVRHTTPVLQHAQTFIVQTVRHRERGDFCFIEYIGGDGSLRLVLPPEVTEVIVRQRDALTTKVRKLTARATMAQRMAGGWKPSFGKRGPRAKGKKKAAKKTEPEGKSS